MWVYTGYIMISYIISYMISIHSYMRKSYTPHWTKDWMNTAKTKNILSVCVWTQVAASTRKGSKSSIMDFRRKIKEVFHIRFRNCDSGFWSPPWICLPVITWRKFHTYCEPASNARCQWHVRVHLFNYYWNWPNVQPSLCTDRTVAGQKVQKVQHFDPQRTDVLICSLRVEMLFGLVRTAL